MSQPSLTCTTAPGHVFASRAELAEHYKSDWHAYNLKRRQAGLQLLTRVEFLARLRAAQAARQEQELLKQRQKQSHLKRRKDKVTKRHDASGTPPEGATTESHSAQPPPPPVEEVEDSPASDAPERAKPEEPQSITIDPCQSLYDSHVSSSMQDNVEYMRRHYDWFIPDAEYLQDLEGLLGYCHEKILIGHMCLQCHQAFASATAVRQHMLSKQHTQLAYLSRDDQEELAVFYDFEPANHEFMTHVGKKRGDAEDGKVQDDEEEEDGWEDVSDDEEAMGEDGYIDDDGEDLYAGYADQVAQMGFSVTPLGELVFPDGRIVGHRSLRRYYQQRPRVQRDSTAVAAARIAAGERLFQGRVYNINSMALSTYRNGSSLSTGDSLALAKLGIAPGRVAGRSGKGILVSSGPDGSFSQLSIYRYRAALRQQSRGEQKGQWLYNKSNQNINRMDKKHNRLMNGVSVAHAKR